MRKDLKKAKKRTMRMDILGKSLPGRGNRDFKAGEVGRCLVCLRNNGKVCVAGA